jgi:uncharacterized protein YjbI with pentapeptide repeats
MSSSENSSPNNDSTNDSTNESPVDYTSNSNVSELLRRYTNRQIRRNFRLMRENLSGQIFSEQNLIESDFKRADLCDAHFENAQLQRANFTQANLDGAYLQGANLTKTILKKADLSEANLTGANLTEAILIKADLTGANLTRANLTRAILEGAILEGANLTGAILAGVILSDIQRQQIQAYIPSIHQEISDSAYSYNLTITSNAFGQKISIPPQLRLVTKFSTSNLCPSFKPLYDKLMLVKLDGKFRFHFEGERGIDATGLSKIVYDFILPVYTQLYFVKTGEFILLKQDANIKELDRDTLQLIKLAKAARSQIYLPIHPQLLELLLLPNPPESIASSNNFNNLYSNLKKRISEINNSHGNISNYLPNISKNQQITSVKNINSLSNIIKAEIILRKKLYDFAFTSWDQYENMATFIKAFWNRGNNLEYHNKGRNIRLDLFTCELNYDIESFKRRLQIKKEETSQFLNLQQVQSLYGNYPALQPLLEYILNPDPAANINRINFVKYVAGTEYTSCIILLALQTVEIGYNTINKNKIYELPFLPHTCFSTLDLFKTPRSKNYQEVWTVERIDEEIRKGTGFSAHNR